MEYRYLGKTGLKVSVISYGFMTIGDQNLMTQLVKTAWESGVNFFDNAEFYLQGTVETLFGNTIKELKIPREDLVISTKIFWGGQGVNRVGLSRKHIIEGAFASLKRLQLDYVDIIYCHRPDFETPLEETCRAFDWLIRKGKAHYWGTSEWPAKRILEAIGICERLGLHKPVVEQCAYSLLERDKMENDYIELLDQHGLGTTVFSPLARGILAGRYNKEIPADSRYAKISNSKFRFIMDKWLAPENIEETRTKCLQLEEIAKEIGCTLPQLALAWVIKNKDVSTAIMGGSKVEQVEQNLQAINFVEKITPEIEERLEKIVESKPHPGTDFKTWSDRKSRR